MNETYSKAWNTIPPESPKFLCAYLGRIARNLAVNRWHSQRAQKRNSGISLLL
ncbi:MAG TPA: hypothetical protein GXZ29_02760 [Clostridiales bacterium]|nr:hypothetical protein [Clostridiales bacterium]